MNKSILILDENSVIHGLISSALDMEGLNLHHEFNPEKFIERASSVMPDLILVGKSDQDPELSICRLLNEHLEQVPVVLMTGSKDRITQDDLDNFHVAGMVRKPFDASDLQQQVGRLIDISDLVGAAYEFRHSQITEEEKTNPLANLDVMDDEVLGLLRGNGEDTGEDTPEYTAMEPGPAAVVSEEVLAETLEPERAFEPVEPEGEAGQTLEALETLEGEFPDAELAAPEDEFDLEELSAEDLLEEEAPEEAILEPVGFDQSLEGEAVAASSVGAAMELEEIEVELPDSALDMESIDQELADGDVEMFESELDAEPPEPPSPEEFKESIPLSVRRMMDLKPVFSKDSHGLADSEEAGDLSFEPDEGEVEAIQSELETLDEIGLDDEMLPESDVDFAEPIESAWLEDEAHEPESPPETFEELHVDALEAEEDLEVLDLDAEELEAGEIDPEMAFEMMEDDLEETTADTSPVEAFDDSSNNVDAEIATEMPPEQSLSVAAEPGETDDDDYFMEEYLGDEEIDEEQIILAEEPEEFPELTEEDEKELDFLVSEEEQELSRLDSLEDEGFAADDEDEEIELDQDEDELIRSSLEEERLTSAGMEIHLDDAEAQDPLFERNFNALDEEEGDYSPDGLGSVPFDAVDEDGAMKEPQNTTITLGAPLGDDDLGGGDEFLSENQEVDEEDIWSPETPPSFLAKPNEEFPRDAIQEPFTGRQEIAGENSPTPRFTPEELLEDPNTMEPILSPDDSILDPELNDLDPSSEIEDFDSTGELEVPEEAMALEMGGFEAEESAEESDDLAAMLGANDHPDASDFLAGSDSTEGTDAEFDDLFSSLQDEIAANPEGEHLDDVLRIEGIRERVSALEFSLPQNESPFSRAIGLYGRPGEPAGSVYPAAMWGIEGGVTQPAPVPPPSDQASPDRTSLQPIIGAEQLMQNFSLLDPDIRTKLGQVLDEIISVSVRKAVQEEMPKLMERMSKET